VESIATVDELNDVADALEDAEDELYGFMSSHFSRYASAGEPGDRTLLGEGTPWEQSTKNAIKWDRTRRVIDGEVPNG
jgi:hypothetical protein